MKEYLEKSISLCDDLADLFNEDYQKLLISLSGDIHDEYKLLMMDEIECVTNLREKLKRIIQFM